MTKLLSSVAGGFAGALTVTILHQLLSRKYAGAARPDLPVHETMKFAATGKAGEPARLKKPLLSGTASQLLASTLYFSLAGSRMKQLATGSLGGLLAGVGAVSLPRKYHYNGSPAIGKKHKWVTIALYLAGGLVSAMVIRWIEKRDRARIVSPYNPPMESYKPVIDITV